MPLLSWTTRSRALQLGSQATPDPASADEALATEEFDKEGANVLPGSTRPGLHRVPHAERLATVHAFLQNRSLHPRPRSARSWEMMDQE